MFAITIIFIHGFKIEKFILEENVKIQNFMGN